MLIDLWAPGLRSVNIDNATGAALAMRHLLATGRTRIAFIGGSPAHYSIAQRAIGYRRAFFEAGRLFDPAYEVTIDAGPIPTPAQHARWSSCSTRRPRPEAVFAYNDAAALAAQRVCTARGLRIPDDIAIVGFDNIPAAAHAARRSRRSRSTRRRSAAAASSCCSLKRPSAPRFPCPSS